MTLQPLFFCTGAPLLVYLPPLTVHPFGDAAVMMLWEFDNGDDDE
ncbi:hypothetical protein A2U01_0083766, partial [Trifolium medium]|nr:hypothetical protein [Trifolium medium]